jgi:uncharacterized OB-fold protein
MGQKVRKVARQGRAEAEDWLASATARSKRWLALRNAEAHKCRECGGGVEPLDEVCRHCGARAPAKVSVSPVQLIVAFTIAALILSVILS